MGDKQSRLSEEGGDGEIPSEGDILAKLCTALSQCPGQSLPLATIVSRLPPSLRSKADPEYVCSWLHRFSIFAVSGPKGEERVMLTVGMLPQAEKPAETVKVEKAPAPAPAPALPGPVGPVGGPIGPFVIPNGTEEEKEKPEKMEKVEKMELASKLSAKEANAVVGDEDNLNPSSVQLRGLPFRATIADVMNFLGDHARVRPEFRFLSPVRDNIRLLSNRDGRPSGFARVFFVSPQAAHKCRDALHKRQMGDRYIEVLACADRRGRRKADDLLKEPALAAAVWDAHSDQEEKERVLQECRDHMSGPGRQQILLSMLGIALSEQSRAYLRRANLGLKHFLARFPHEFLIDGPKGCEKVHWLSLGMTNMTNMTNMTTLSTDDAAAVASLLGSENTLSWGLGSLALPNPEPHPEPQTPDKRFLSPTKPGSAPHSHFMATPSDWGTPAHHHVNLPSIDLDNLPAVSWPPYSFPGPQQHDPMMPILDFSENEGGWQPNYNWQPYSPWNPSMHWGEPLKGPKKSKAPDGSLRSHAHLHPQAHPFANRTAATGNGSVEEQAPGENVEEKSGIAALRLRGLPFSVTIQDVLAFFAQYEVADLISDGPGAAHLLPKANGRPSGQAVVQMRSRKDAETAQKKLNHQWVGSRYIEVFVYGEDEEDLVPQGFSEI